MDALQNRRAVLCLGAARVELVCERHVAALTEADSFHPRAGGGLANVATVAASLGAPVSVVGSAGDDAWGRWLRARLAGAGVDTSLFALAPGRVSQLAFVIVDGGGEVTVAAHGEPDPVLPGSDPRVTASSCLFLTSETLVAPEDREVTMRARSVALEHDVPIVFAPGVSVGRWRSAADAAASLNAVVPGALLLCVDEAEATLMTGEQDVERAALALVKAGARLVVITLGADGAMLRGELRADVDGVPARVLSTLGVGDAFTGTLLARLALSDFYPSVVAASLREALAAAARASERWGVVD